MEPAAALHFSLPASLLLLLLLLLLSLCALASAQFTVVGPTNPILAMVGENTTLRCHLSPEKNAEDMEVRWFRSQFSPAVFVYKGGRERTEEQMEEYRGRITFVSNDINRGSVALVIHNVTAQENGIYCCYFQEGRSYDEAILRLVVAESFMPSASPWMVALAVILTASPWMVSMTVILAVFIIFMAVSICCIKKLQREKKILSGEKKVEQEEKEIAQQLQEELRWRRTFLHAGYELPGIRGPSWKQPLHGEPPSAF
ncbi:BTN2A2 isoform 9 [Pan troglodytes]|uniref:BTN2A2 isoform 9 n=2 Tax=Pan troglodytes TaxID=9598 RepID=A0A6D2WR37_PANTR|nr:BTN2A2 isoform 9 [Pan troglodytes]